MINFNYIFILLFKDILGGSDTNTEAKKNEIQDLEMISERLKEEITHLKEDIKRTISDKEKVFLLAIFNKHRNRKKVILFENQKTM